MKRIAQTTQTPIGGYTYVQKETGHTMNARTFSKLLADVTSHRRANNLPIPFNIDDDVEKYICDNRPELCREPPKKLPSKDRQLTLELAVRFTKTMFYAGAERVDQAEAEQRAEICSQCEDNISPTGCDGCGKGLVKKAVQFIAGNRTTSKDAKLKSCRHCGCFNAAQIWIPLKALSKLVSGEENEGLPQHCWKKRL